MQSQQHIPLPITEKIKEVAGFFGIRTGEEPEYMLEESDGNKEVRSYLPYVVAYLELKGDYQNALEETYQELADYVLGKNSTKTQMAMTSPVLQEQKDSKWRMCFILPAKVTAASAPIPDNKEIKIESRPSEIIAAIEYSGINSREKISEKKQELLKWLHKETAFKAKAEPRIAQYDPPMTIPFMRRNEIQFLVNKANFKN